MSGFWISLTGNGGTVGRGGHPRAVLEQQRDSAAGGGGPLQSGGLADGEGVSAIGVLEGVGAAGGSNHGREDGYNQADEGAHSDRGAGSFVMGIGGLVEAEVEDMGTAGVLKERTRRNIAEQ